MKRWLTAFKLIGFPVLVFGGGLLLLNQLGRSTTLAIGEKPLYVRSGYNAEDAREYWSALDQAGALSTEARLLKVDLFFPIFYGGALLAGILAAWRAMGRPRFWNLAAVPVWLAVLADWMENSSLLYLLRSFMKGADLAQHAGLVQFASTATRLKFLFIGVSWAALIFIVGKFIREGKRA